MSLRRTLTLCTVLVIVLVGVALVRRGLQDQSAVLLAGDSTWQLGPDIITIRRIEIKDGPWTGRVDQPPKVLEAVLRRFPSLRDWWELSHREYAEGPRDTIYVSVDLHVSGPNTERLLSTLQVGLVTPTGVATHIDGHWTALPGQPADLNVSIPVPAGTRMDALEVRLSDSQHRQSPIRRASS